MTTVQSYDFFIAYPGPASPFATKLFASLTKLGQAVFLDTVTLPPGSIFTHDIPKALANSKVLTILVTRESQNAWYDKEEMIQGIKLSRENKITIIPVYIDGAESVYGLNALSSIKCANSEHDRVAIELYATNNQVAAQTEGKFESGVLKNTGSTSEEFHTNWLSSKDSAFWCAIEVEAEQPFETPWSSAAWNSPLWPADGQPPLLLRNLCVQAATHAERHTDILQNDAWFDAHYPTRVLDRVSELCDQLSVHLTCAEAALLTYAVFYREAAYGAAFQAISQGIPVLSDADFTSGMVLPEAIRLVAAAGQARPALSHRLKHLQRLGCTPETKAVESWLVHMAIVRFPGQWSEQTGTLPSPPIKYFDSAQSVAAQSALRSLFQRERLRKISRCVRCDPERLLGENWGDTYEVAVSIGQDLPSVCVSP